MSYHVEGKTALINDKDCSAFFTRTGYTVKYEFVSGGNEGYLQSGEYQEDEIGKKAVITFQVMPLGREDLSALLRTIHGSHINTLYYYDPFENDYRRVSVTRPQLSPAQYRGRGSDGVEYWTAGTLTVREK